MSVNSSLTSLLSLLHFLRRLLPAPSLILRYQSPESYAGTDMGNGNSTEPKETEPKESRRSRLRQKLNSLRNHRRLRREGSSGSVSGASNQRAVTNEDFAGIALLTLIGAEMKFKDKWLACVSFGEQTFRTEITDNTEKPIWNSDKKLLLERNGPSLARISVFETNRLSKNNIVGYCELDLLDFLTQESDSSCNSFDLLDPTSSSNVVGTIFLSCSVEDPAETEKRFAKRILSIVDYNEDGKLSISEFADLISAFGNRVAANQKEELFKAADLNGDGVVSIDELAALLALQQEKEPLINNCPVCGEALQVSDKLNAMIHMTLCFDEGTGNQVMTGGFLTDRQASYGWMFKLSEWAHLSTYDVGLNTGSSASHIVVIDRKTKRFVEELIDPKIVLSMRAIYQSKIGLRLMDQGAKEILQNISEKQGKKMNSVESAQNIPKFLEFFKDQINMAEVKYPLDHFKTFNEFFIRELKPGARSITCMDRDDVAVCAADCRLMAFQSVEDSTRFWIKGRKFSVKGLLGKDVHSDAFADGSLVIFRLAPQDYHRFHAPVSGVIEKFVDVPGSLYTVNPIAVNSKYCNVFTENKRTVAIISTQEFGKVAFVAIGATMVGSINFVRKEDEHLKKGDELGYFSFGGSTVICVFEKDSIRFDEDLVANSARSLETLVTVGMQLGVTTRTTSPASLIPKLENSVLTA